VSETIGDQIVAFVAENPGCAMHDVLEGVDVVETDKSAAAHLKHLVDEGRLLRTGDRMAYRYSVTSGPRPATAKRPPRARPATQKKTNATPPPPGGRGMAGGGGGGPGVCPDRSQAVLRILIASGRITQRDLELAEQLAR
jgi:hypothetical protein